MENQEKQNQEQRWVAAEIIWEQQTMSQIPYWIVMFSLITHPLYGY